ncbi:methionyl-tRNA formyltransferase [Aurantiacibacter rhizosphaerae]|uniref:Methionyl-tRNA formyltransferase n=1 Tax=Aurantiacibacter rhizosphaerae TaxID=2691582 RepID=A0A844XAS0_9SPHN|nr:formyltransferase family protein [Aurantiacibacter rhizosphaerae]MWV27581.1 methionyl-tRNA formyltransferase [Aurantiacibacter rhizosphaerae]
MLKAALVGCVGSTALAAETLARSPEWSLEIIVTLELEAASRHSDFEDLAGHAERADARLFRTLNSNSAETLQAIRDADVDFIFVIGWSQLCRDEFMNLKPDAIIGYHPAALPRLRGRAALPWTILLQEPITAGSLMWLGDDVDDGDIIDQQFFHVAPDETAETLYAKHQDALETMLNRTLATIASGKLPRQPQEARYATYAAKRTLADGLIDWNQSAIEIERLVRAVGKPYPGAFTFDADNKLTIWRSSALPDDGRYHAMNGQIIERADGEITIMTGDGLLRVEDWETASGKTPLQHAILGRER